MRNLILFIFLIGFSAVATAQKIFFLYVQSENNLPFYLKMDDKIHSSSANGFLILSRLPDSTYLFSVGFPGSTEEARFSVALNNRDRGLLIKKVDNTLTLFDLQSLSLIRAAVQQTSSKYSFQRREDAFTKMLARASNDSTLLLVYTEEPIPKSTTVKAEPAAVKEVPRETQPEPIKQSNDVARDVIKEPVSDKDTQATEVKDIAKKTEADANPSNTSKENITIKTEDSPPQIIEEKKADPVSVNTEPYKRSQVTRRSESSTSEGFGLVFLDDQKGVVDTIRIIIPNPRIAFGAGKEEPVTTSSTPLETPVLVAPRVQPKPSCKTHASDNDFLKTRRGMAGEGNEDDMLTVARKAFRTKCFTTDQIKNLSALFLTAHGKYRFFDLAYTHVSDQDQFGSLQSELKDEYYVRRFKALIGT